MQIVILISQIRVNSMTVFRMKSADVNGPLHQFGKFSHSEVSLTSNVEQVCVWGVSFFPSLHFLSATSLCDLSLKTL